MNYVEPQGNGYAGLFDETFSAFTYRASVIRNDGTYRDGGYLMGVTWWCIFDWYSHQHAAGFQSMGLYRMNRDSLKLVGTTLKEAYAPFYEVGGTVTDVEAETISFLPEDFSLEQNYPNPFNPQTKIVFSIPQNEFVSVKIYDVLGSEVAKLLSEDKPAGKYELTFDAGLYNIGSGIYFYRIEAGKFTSVRKMVYMK